MQHNTKAHTVATPTPYASVVRPNKSVDAFFTLAMFAGVFCLVAWFAWRRVRGVFGYRTVTTVQKGK